MTSTSMIEAHGLRKRFGATVALDGIDLEVPAGAILGVLGTERRGQDDRGAHPDHPLRSRTAARRVSPATTW